MGSSGETTGVAPALKFRLVPTPGKIVVREDNFQYKGRIIVPEVAQRRPTTGVVLEVGDGVGEMIDVPPMYKTNTSTKELEIVEPAHQQFKPRFEVGQKVVYGLYSGTVINFKGQPAFRILGQDEVLAIVEGDAELEGVGV